MFKNLLVFLWVGVFSLASSTQVLGHGHGGHHGHDHHHHHASGNDRNSETDVIEKYALILKAATELVPQMVNGSNHSVPTSEAWTRINGRKVFFNDYFWQLVRQVSALYYEDIRADCEACAIPHPEAIVAEAEDMLSEGWLKNRSKRIGQMVSERYASTAIELAARYGLVAGILKVAGELVEDALLVLLKMPGAHIFCEVITASLTLASRKIQMASRAFANSRELDQSRLMTVLKMAYLGRKIRRAQNRVTFASPLPIELDEEGVALVDGLGPQEKKWFSPLPEGKRARFLGWLESSVNKTHQDLALLGALASPSWSQRRRQEALERRLDTLQTLHRKVYEGRRYKRFFLMVSRKSSRHYLAGKGDLDADLRGPVLWVLAAEINLFDPTLRPTSNAPEENSYDQKIPPSSVRAGLAHEFLARHRQQRDSPTPQEEAFVESVLTDIESLFDPQVHPTKRYLTLVSLETMIGGFLYSVSRRVNDDLWSQALNLNEAQKTSSRFSLNSRYWWRFGNLPYYFDQYFDFLRVATVHSHPERNHWLKYEAMSYFLTILESLRPLPPEDASAPNSEKLLNELARRLQILKSERFWLPKRRIHHWLPFRRAKLQCEGLAT